MADAQYQADAKRIGLEVHPLSGEAMYDRMKTINDMPKDLAMRLRTLIMAQTQR
jgi:hypothetical protein